MVVVERPITRSSRVATAEPASQTPPVQALDVRKTVAYQQAIEESLKAAGLEPVASPPYNPFSPRRRSVGHLHRGPGLGFRGVRRGR